MPALQTTRRDAGDHFRSLDGHKYCQLVTFRRGGTAVPTPVWFAVDGDQLYVKTEDPSGKVKRIRNDARVRVAPCTIAGRQLGAAVGGVARILAGAETGRAERTLRRRYGLGRRLFERLVEPLLRWRGSAPLYLEITP
jgi:uncharacterized protein